MTNDSFSNDWPTWTHLVHLSRTIKHSRENLMLSILLYSKDTQHKLIRFQRQCSANFDSTWSTYDMYGYCYLNHPTWLFAPFCQHSTFIFLYLKHWMFADVTHLACCEISTRKNQTAWLTFDIWCTVPTTEAQCSWSIGGDWLDLAFKANSQKKFLLLLFFLTSPFSSW